jgi:CHAT domain-containing protein
VPRVILVAPGDLARVPWAAATRGDGAYAIELMAISQAVSARMFCGNAALPPMPQASAGLIVADPHTDGQARGLPSARLEAYAIGQALFPQARLTGRRPDGTASPSGAGTLDQVRAWLATSNPAAGGLLHLACTGYARPGSDAYALMADGVRLTATEILALRGRAERRPLDLVVLAGGRTGLSLTGYDEAFGLGTAFLAGGVRTVLATRWTVPDAAAPAVLFMTHLLRRSGRPAWAALRAAQLWMLDPQRSMPPEMPPELASALKRADPAKPIAWAAVTHWGQ